MTRGNKKKKLAHHPVVPPDDSQSIALLMNEERTLMISRAIVSILKIVNIYMRILYRQVLRDMELI